MGIGQKRKKRRGEARKPPRIEEETRDWEGNQKGVKLGREEKGRKFEKEGNWRVKWLGGGICLFREKIGN